MTTDTTRLLNAPWDTITLSSLVGMAAAAAPKRVFLRDCPRRLEWNGVEARELTFETFERSALFLAAQLRTLGVQPGDTLLLMLPNSVELPLALVAARMAGAVPAIAPAEEKVDTLRAMAERCEATAILTMDRIGDIKLGEKARQVAARLMNIRCVAGFGFDLPDGIVSLEGWSEEDVVPIVPSEDGQDSTALVTFARAEGAICACRRTEGQIIGDMLLAKTLVTPAESGMISLMQPGSAASVAAGFLLALQAKVPLTLIGPYEQQALSEALMRQPGALLLAPDHFIAQLMKDDPASALAGVLPTSVAIMHVAGPKATILRPGPASGAVLINFEERGIFGLQTWPQDGVLSLSDALDHLLEGVLTGKQPYLVFDGDDLTGFGAAIVLRRQSGSSAGKAA